MGVCKHRVGVYIYRVGVDVFFTSCQLPECDFKKYILGLIHIFKLFIMLLLFIRKDNEYIQFQYEL